MDQKLLESLGQKNSKNQMKSISRIFYDIFHFISENLKKNRELDLFDFTKFIFGQYTF